MLRDCLSFYQSGFLGIIELEDTLQITQFQPPAIGAWKNKPYKFNLIPNGLIKRKERWVLTEKKKDLIKLDIE